MLHNEATGDSTGQTTPAFSRRELGRVLGAGLIGAALPARLDAAPNEANSRARSIRSRYSGAEEEEERWRDS